MTNNSFKFNANLNNFKIALTIHNSAFSFENKEFYQKTNKVFEEHCVILYDEYAHYVGKSSFKGILLGILYQDNENCKDNAQSFNFNLFEPNESYGLYYTDMGIYRVLRFYEGKPQDDQIWEGGEYFDRNYVYKLFAEKLGGNFYKVETMRDFQIQLDAYIIMSLIIQGKDVLLQDYLNNNSMIGITKQKDYRGKDYIVTFLKKN